MMVAGAGCARPTMAPRNAEALIAAEVRNCRDNVGLIDVSTLGGFDIRGPDAAESCTMLTPGTTSDRRSAARAR